MEFSNINLKKVTENDLMSSLLNGSFSPLTNQEKKDLQKTIEDSFGRGDYIIARNSMIIGIYFDRETTFSAIKRKGIFRYSKYVTKKCILKDMTTDLLNYCKIFKIDDSTINYLKSINNLNSLYDNYNLIVKNINSELIRFKQKYKGASLYKTLLSFIDYLFMQSSNSNIYLDFPILQLRSKEELSSAISYIITLIYKRGNKFLQDIANPMVSYEYIKEKEIDKLLINVCQMLDLKEVEIYVDHFSYVCIKYEAYLKLIPPNIDLDKSIRMGFIRNEIQMINDRRNIIFNAATIDDLINYANQNGDLLVCNQVGLGIFRRYRLEIAEPALEAFLILFKEDKLFQEELIYLSHVFKEQLLDFDTLSNFKIKNNLTLLEFMKIKRVFYLLSLLFKNKLLELKDLNAILMSMTPVISKNQLYEIFEKLTSRDNFDSYLEVTSWNPIKHEFFDLQYQPILFDHDFFMIPLFVLNESNSIRNLFASEYKHNNKNFFSDGTKDKLVEKLGFAFKNAGFTNYQQTVISNAEIDLFLVKGNSLFLFECKQSLNPTSVYDLRTTYDYIKKAEKQLDLLNQEFLNGNLKRILESKYEISLEEISNVVSVIVLSTRLFNGNSFKYPIRNIHEIENVLQTGIIETVDGEFSIWIDTKLADEDILNYFSKQNELFQVLFNSLSEEKKKYELGKTYMEFNHYYMNTDEANEQLKKYTATLRKIVKE